MKANERIQQYLERYSAADSSEAALLVGNHATAPFKRVLCVPFYDETPGFFDRLDQHPDIDNTLVIAVINAPESACEQTRLRTQGLLDHLRQQNTVVAEGAHAFRIKRKTLYGSYSVLVMDHCSTGRTLSPKEGVGLARKLATDAALKLWARNQIESPWLYQTDADATLPNDYFALPKSSTNTVAFHCSFEHVGKPKASLSQRMYDLKLDYYVAGLAYAGSPYAYYSLGSAVIVHADAYAVVRGYPRRSAGEDFYLLNKLAKIGDVQFRPSCVIQLRERLSTRVVFGTGPGVNRFETMESPLSATEFYAPECFEGLKLWLDFSQNCVEKFAGVAEFSAIHFFNECLANSKLKTRLRAAANGLDLFSVLTSTVIDNTNESQGMLQLKLGMDALKTLRLIHALRDEGYSNVTASSAYQTLNSIRSELGMDASCLRCDRYSDVFRV